MRVEFAGWRDYFENPVGGKTFGGAGKASESPSSLSGAREGFFGESWVSRFPCGWEKAVAFPEKQSHVGNAPRVLFRGCGRNFP